jgi:hypothetical protein
MIEGAIHQLENKVYIISIECSMRNSTEKSQTTIIAQQ